MSDLTSGIKDPADSFPARFSRMLFHRYPDWRQYQVPPNLRYQKAHDLVVEVPSRFAPLCPLRIETMGNGIILSWAGWHTHCDKWGGSFTEEQFIDELFGYVARLLTEKIIIAIDWNNGPGGTGGTIEADKLEEELATGWPSFCFEDKSMTLISWNGTYDQGEFDPAKCR